jgi:hypothetical protein
LPILRLMQDVYRVRAQFADKLLLVRLLRIHPGFDLTGLTSVARSYRPTSNGCSRSTSA